MIFFSIPGFYTHYKLNKALLDLYIYKKPYVFKDNIKINSIYDCFPGTTWMGGRINPDPTIPIEDMKDIMEEFTYKYRLEIRHVFTNNFINDHLLYEPLGNLILQLSPNQTGININSEELKRYIEKTYPKKFLFNWSATKILKDEQNINNYSKENTVIPSFLDVNNNFSLLSKLKHKNNIELVVDDLCMNFCSNYYKHYIEFSKSNLYDTTANIDICNCKQNFNYYDRRVGKKHNISPESIEKDYLPLGFNHFKITGREDSEIQVIESYVRYLVKTEWKDYIRNELLGIVYT